LFHLSQWADDPEKASPWKADWSATVDATVPGIERRGVTAYRHYRSDQPRGPAADPGCVVFVERRFEQPRRSRATALVDTLFAAPESAQPTPELISANFFISIDGARVLNYAEWTTEQAHRSLADETATTVEASPEWEAVHTWPGLVATEFKRSTHWRSAARRT
jgi:hypothetical protein